MTSAIFRSDNRLRVVEGQVRRRCHDLLDACGASNMENLRIPVPRRKKDAPIIEAFQCSRCEWEYVLQQQRRDTLVYDEVARAAWKFDAHHCELYRSRNPETSSRDSQATRAALLKVH